VKQPNPPGGRRPARPSTRLATRQDRLHALEDEIRGVLEQFYDAGVKLKEIRDDELYREDGFPTWEEYCKDRWGWSRDYTYKLIRAAEYRAVLPDVDKKSTERAKDWNESTVRELTRMEDKRDAARVAAKVLEAVTKSEEAAAADPTVKPLKLTASTVRKFVDEDLGVDRAAKAQETKRQNEERAKPDLRLYLYGMMGQIESETAKISTVDRDYGPDVWDQFIKDNPHLIRDLAAACESLVRLLRTIEAGASAGREEVAVPGENWTEEQSIGLRRAYQAMRCLKRIPEGHPSRVDAFRVVRKWMEMNP
jgi:hypothetical protein